VVDPRKYGLPQRRKRIFGWAINYGRFDVSESEANAILTRWEARIKTMELSDGYTVNDLLLDDDSAQVVKAKREMEANKLDDKAISKWPEKTMEMLEAKGLKWTDAPVPDDVHESDWADILCGREKKILAVEAALHPGVEMTELVHTVGRTSRDDDDTTEGIGGTPPTLPNSRWWSWRRSRLCVGDEHMRAQAYPIEEVADPAAFANVSNTLKVELAGNAFPAVSYAAVRIAAWLETPAYCFEALARISDSEGEEGMCGGLD
jgi:site-specific DNA-cytosine methylase